MATYYFRNTGDVNWGTATNWSLTDGGGATGAVPTATDNAIFTNNSGNCTVNASARVCLTLNFSTYTNTITMTNQISVSGNVTLGAGMGIAGAGRLVLLATATLTSNGKIWPNELATGGSSVITFTLADDWVVSGALNLTNSGTTGSTQKNTFNGFTLSFGGSLTVFTNGNRDVGGTTKFIMNGTGNWINGTGSSVRNNLDINTTGTFTFASAQINYSTGTLTYIAGTVITTGNNFVMETSATLDTSGMTFTNVTLSSNSNPILTLSSDLYCSNFTISGAASTTQTINNNKVFIVGSLTNGRASATATNTGTTEFHMIGTGIQQFIQSVGQTSTFNCTIVINKPSGTLIIGDNGLNFRYGTRTIQYLQGTIDVRTPMLLISACTLLNFNKVFISSIRIAVGVTVTMNEFFSGKATQNVNVSSATAGSTYTIAFQDGFEKIAKFVDVSDCVISRPLQLLMLTNNSLVRCTGVRMNNQSPNGVPKNMPSVQNGMTFPAFSLTSDPAIN
jgi:hypothetical protein